MANNSPLLTVSNVAAGYSRLPVLHDISLTIDEGEVFALIGPNGHGKSTLLQVLSGLLPLNGGTIEFSGQDISRMPVHLRVASGLVHVPQGDQLFPEMSIEENLLMGAYLCDNSTEIASRLSDVFDLFPKLADQRNQTANGLSGGERRMVGIGRGLMAGGRLMMVDEPSLGLAPLIIEQIYNALKQLARTGRTFIVVEENPVRIAEIASNLALLEGGRIIWSGSKEKLKNSPEITAAYFGVS